MSYSLCIKCEKMVHAYAKYCFSCVTMYGVTQDVNWHKNNRFDNWHEDRKKEFEKDSKKVSDE